MAQLADDPVVTSSGRLYVSPPGAASVPNPIPGNAADPWAAYSDMPPPAQGAPSVPLSGQQSGDPWAAYSDKPPPVTPPKNDYSGAVGAVEAGGRGLLHGATMGLEPAIAGANAAADPDIEAAARKFGIDPAAAKTFLTAVFPNLKPLYGAGRVAIDTATHEPTLSEQITGPQQTPAQAAYSKVRGDEALKNKEAREQQPVSYVGGDIAGAVAAPLPGFGAVRTAAPLAERIGRGVAEGMVGGGAYGAGNAVGEGKPANEVASDAASGVATGGLIGGAFGGALGRRPAPTVQTSGQRAAQTAEALGAPLPRGVVSDSPMIQATTAKMSEVPFAGERIGERVRETQRAAGEHVEGMASNLVGGEPTRTTAGNSAAPALRQVIEHNNGEIDRAYNTLRGEINPDQHFPMPNLQRALQQIRLRRSRAGWPNPGEGLQQAENVANGTGHAGGFNGVHRLRRDLREAGNPQKANPGYDAGDFRFLRRAVDVDLRAGVRHVSTNPNRAESLFNTAEMTAGPMIQLNEKLEKLAGRHGEAIVGALLGSAREKGGNIQLLRDLRQSMDPAAFNQIAGVLLHELGQAEGQSGGFSLAKFATNWAKVSDPAKAIMFSPQHRAWIDNIADMGNHLKDASRFINNSHTGSIIVLLDIMKDVALLSTDLAKHGSLGWETAAGAGTTAASILFARYLASPASAASMSRWTTAYRALTANQPTPARIAAFKVATRNLANNIHVPFERIMSTVSDRAVVKADEPNKKQLGTDQRPRK